MAPPEARRKPVLYQSKASTCASEGSAFAKLPSSSRTMTTSQDEIHPLPLLSPNDPAQHTRGFLAPEDMIVIEALRTTSLIAASQRTSSTAASLVQAYGAAAFQNKQLKATMEDECILVPRLSPTVDAALFAVYDGHGGGFVSGHLQQTLHRDIRDRLERGVPVAEALETSFAAIDAALEDMEEADACGSTAVVAVVCPTHVVVANTGDSHGLLFDGAATTRLTADHHVRNRDEVARIKGNHGIILNHRVSGVSRVTRAFGQNNEKDFIIPTPHVTSVATAAPAFLVLMSDGVSDVLEDDAITRYVRKGLEAGWAPDRICRELLEICRVKRAMDNMTIVVVVL